MEKLQHTFVLRAMLDGDWEPTTYRQSHVMSQAQIDAISAFDWPGSGAMRAIREGASTIRARWQSRLVAQPPRAAISGEARPAA